MSAGKAITLLTAAVVVLGTAVIWYLDPTSQPGEWLSKLERGEIYSALLLMGLMIAAVVIGPIPTLPITVTMGAAFGLWFAVWRWR